MIAWVCTAAARYWQCRVLLLAVVLIAGFGYSGLSQVFSGGKACWQGSPCSPGAKGGKGLHNRSAASSSARKRAAALRKKMAAVATPHARPTMASSVDQKVVIQVDQDDKAMMELALNNAENIFLHYESKGQTVAIEVVAYGPGLHMLRSDSSPVKARIASMVRQNPRLSFVACGNTQASQSKSEGKEIALLSQAKVVPSGVVRLIELQEQGYTYIRP
jgi:intracellular sulfur oxidation DsrE/DsrF family protein